MGSRDTIAPARIHAIVPAAGRSRRMGASKLLLPWSGRTVVESLLSLLLEEDLATVSILIRKDDREPAHRLREFVAGLPPHRSARLSVLSADPSPREMRDSVALLLRHVRFAAAPDATDAWMLTPADAVALRPETIQQLIAGWRRHPRGVLIPTYMGDRGHPTVFGWKLAPFVEALPSDRGVNGLLTQPGVEVSELPLDDPAILSDLDTPMDYEKWRPPD